MVIQVAQKISPASFATVVSHDTHCSNDKHDRAHSHAQPGLVHVNLLRHVRIAAGAGRWRKR
jgi:hypothetical protein